MKRFACLFLFAVFLLAGCSRGLLFDPPPTPTADPRRLMGTGWGLVEMNGRALLPDSEVTLYFHAQIEGKASCNFYKADYSTTADQFQVLDSFYSITVMGCYPKELMDQENTYWGILTKAAKDGPLKYQIDPSVQPEELRFLDQDGNTLLRHRALERYSDE